MLGKCDIQNQQTHEKKQKQKENILKYELNINTVF